ncbi:Rne/Rng family ribonuclease [Anaeromyxobacter sp. Fw109-5]|uniref:Rne/Rng family ribonuclease n=1 Tax=Anaeromyxobacter sp. (strain Fw109-5) TaxID=404589 RepID=UPI0000ED780A|nr:Rne/Rng family ribonuclease [Anaeromyxobacter sp. Fw109-5]ABS24951.1 ribonuclease, Rne/Rng family [Anaeromyxobacter sp. Fw109-5]
MAGNSILVINAAGAETRVALVENNTIHEYYLERKREKGIVGNIYKGRVVRVLPGMQAAFVDIGLDKAAFLYVGDVYGDPEFSEEFELTEGEHRVEVPEVPTEQEAEAEEARAQAVSSQPPAVAAAPLEGEAVTPAPTPSPVPEGEPQAPLDAAPIAEGGIDAPPAPLSPIPLTQEIGMAAVPTPPPLPVPPVADAGPTEPLPAEAGAAAVAEVPAPVPVAEPAPEAAPVADRLQAPREKADAREARADREPKEGKGGERRRDREERGRRDGRDREAREGRERGNRNGHEREKRSKEPKNIQDLLKEGQEVIVQVAKDPIGTKGARITSHISLPGRHLVFMPTVDHIGISRRIEKDSERRRLREIVDRMRPDGTGFIVRTVAENVEAGKLEADIRFLIQVWNEIIRTKDKVSAPALLHGDLDLILRATRDLFTADVGKLVIDDRDEYERILRFVHEQAPHLESQIEYYRGEEPIFDAYGIEQELKRASQRKVWLKSGGYIIMDQAEALTAIDVNSGRYVGKKNLEETITKINVEAAKEIVYQLRLRNIGGIIIIDFIDMDKPQNRDKVFKALQDALGRDKAKTNVLKISELGLVEMTRKRVRESVTRVMNEPCSYCEGKGHLKSKITITYEIFREIRREAVHFPEPVLVVNCHPEVARILQGSEREELRYLMDRFNKTIQVKPQSGYHQEQFDIYGRQERIDQPRDRERERGRGRDRDRGGRGKSEEPATPPADAAGGEER